MKVKEKNENQLFEKCPNCDGSGEFSYPVSHTQDTLLQLYYIKTGWNFPQNCATAYRLRISCEFCRGKGGIDWIENIRRQEYNRSSSSFDGCLYILFKELKNDPHYKNYTYNLNNLSLKPLHAYYRTRDEKHLSKLFELAQERHDGLICFTKSIMEKSAGELLEIREKHTEAESILRKSYPGNKIPTERKINSVLDKVGLSEYKPKKYAHFI